jgi:cysteinyl-tRNA synthetase
MSKSLGNLVMVRDLLNEYSADSLRIYLAMHHYRESWSYDENKLKKAVILESEIREALSSESGLGELLDLRPQENEFFQALDDDLDSPTALESIHKSVREILNGSVLGMNISKAKETLRELGGVLGLRMDNPGPDPQVTRGWDQHLTRFLD